MRISVDLEDVLITRIDKEASATKRTRKNQIEFILEKHLSK